MQKSFDPEKSGVAGGGIFRNRDVLKDMRSRNIEEGGGGVKIILRNPDWTGFSLMMASLSKYDFTNQRKYLTPKFYFLLFRLAQLSLNLAELSPSLFQR
jgi:hypothetical protein